MKNFIDKNYLLGEKCEKLLKVNEDLTVEKRGLMEQIDDLKFQL